MTGSASGTCFNLFSSPRPRASRWRELESQRVHACRQRQPNGRRLLKLSVRVPREPAGLTAARKAASGVSETLWQGPTLTRHHPESASDPAR
jgi:hypothetical protein